MDGILIALRSSWPQPCSQARVMVLPVAFSFFLQDQTVGEEPSCFSRDGLE